MLAVLAFSCGGDPAAPKPDESATSQTTDELPVFVFHPDPIGTHTFWESEEVCAACEEARGYVYAGPTDLNDPDSDEDYFERICPWCIADGSAAETLDLVFHDPTSFSTDPPRFPVDDPPLNEDDVRIVSTRTPGFFAQQEPTWWVHCNRPAAFVGTPDRDGLLAAGEQAVQSIRDNAGIVDDAEWEEFLDDLDEGDSLRAYLFRCVECGTFGGYQDSQ